MKSSALVLFSLHFLLARAEDEVTDDALNEYFLEVIEGFRLTMPLGLEELNIPVLEPLYVDKRSWTYNENDATKFTLIITNTTVTGLSDFQVEFLDIKIPKLEATIKLNFPLLKSDGNYNLKGIAYRILPLKGNGPWWLELTDFSVDLRVKGELTEKKKFQLNLLSAIFDVVDVKMHFSNLLESGHNLSQVVNAILRKNGRRILSSLTSRLRDVLQKEIAPYVDLLNSTVVLEFTGRDSTYSNV